MRGALVSADSDRLTTLTGSSRWKNVAPWVYDVDPEKIIIEESALQQMK